MPIYVVVFELEIVHSGRNRLRIANYYKIMSISFTFSHLTFLVHKLFIINVMARLKALTIKYSAVTIQNFITG